MEDQEPNYLIDSCPINVQVEKASITKTRIVPLFSIHIFRPQHCNTSPQAINTDAYHDHKATSPAFLRRFWFLDLR